MILFWDTSAVLAVVFRERHTPEALEANRAASRSYAWSWMRVEAEAGLARRRATEAQWEHLLQMLGAIRFVGLSDERTCDLCEMNRRWRLRASDAGHLYCFGEASKVVPGIQLVAFDAEMLDAARRLNLSVWKPFTSQDKLGGRVRERRAGYRARRKAR